MRPLWIETGQIIVSCRNPTGDGQREDYDNRVRTKIISIDDHFVALFYARRQSADRREGFRIGIPAFGLLAPSTKKCCGKGCRGLLKAAKQISLTIPPNVLVRRIGLSDKARIIMEKEK